MSDLDMETIECAAKLYANTREALAARVRAADAELEAIKRQRLPGIKAALARAAEAETRLRTVIEAAPELFERPKTVILHGIKVGYRKATGKLIWDDADQVVALIRKHCPDQADVLIVVRETPSKSALSQLSVAELKRLGVRVVETGEEIVIAPTDSEVDRLVDALLKSALDERPEAA
jgi:hypothetical protein